MKQEEIEDICKQVVQLQEISGKLSNSLYKLRNESTGESEMNLSHYAARQVEMIGEQARVIGVMINDILGVDTPSFLNRGKKR